MAVACLTLIVRSRGPTSDIAALIEAEAKAAEEAEVTSDPNEPLPPNVKVTRGRSPRADRD